MLYSTSPYGRDNGGQVAMWTQKRITVFFAVSVVKWIICIRWLVESYLIGGIGVASWLFWEFFHVRWKILFSHGEEYVRWDWTHTRWDWNEHQKLKFLLWWRGPLVMIFDGAGAGGPDGGGGRWGWQGARWDKAVGSRRARCQGRGSHHNINESPKWNSSLLDFFSIIVGVYGPCFMLQYEIK